MESTQTIETPKIYTAEEYLRRERRSKNKHEFYNGHIIKMPGATYTHNLIAANILTALGSCLYEKDFIVLNSDTKIHIPRLESFVYPDAVVICEKPLFYDNRTDIILNPLLIVEVASKWTRDYDRGSKFQHYKTLPSFEEYVLIEQSLPWVLASYKTAEHTWVDMEATDATASIYLKSVDCTIDVSRIYKNVTF